jgi:glycosyltransferase involved in cell wall biosynthesis
MSYSVIIPSYQRPQMLARALRSIYGQTVLPEAIYLVVDEVEDWQRYAFLNEEFDGRLKTTFTGGGFGGAKARNAGLDQAQEEFVFFLDDDDEWLPTKIEKQMMRLNACPDVIGVTCGRFLISSDKETTIVEAERHVRRYYRMENLIGGFSSFGFRRNSLVQSLRLDGSLRSAQDYDFYLRLFQYGEVGVVEEPLIRFHLHDAVRITTSSHSHRFDTLKRVLESNRALFSSREYRFCRAKIELMTAFDRASFFLGVYVWLRAAGKLILSCIYPNLTLSVLIRAGVSLLWELRRRRLKPISIKGGEG